jgi:hypothetical protein
VVEGGEELESLGNNAKLRDLGLERSDRLVKDFMAEMKDYKSEERALFYMTFAGNLLAKMYSDVRKDITERHDAQSGDQVARKLLETAFSLISVLLRRNGEEVQASVRVNFTDVANFRANEKPEVACDHNVCKCSLDADGRCAECFQMFTDFFSRFSKMIQIMQTNKLMETQFCWPCAPRYMDLSLAQIVKEEVSLLPIEGAEALMSALFMASQNLQALPMPLTKKAWDELQARP